MYKRILATIAITVCTFSCSDSPPDEPTSEGSSGWEEGTITEQSAEPTATAQEPAVKAELEPAEGAAIEGEAKFFDDPDGVRVVLEVAAAPAGKIGVHIHEKGDCSDIGGQSMGAHLAPEGAKHALPEEQGAGARHMGDLGNIDVGPDGKGRLEAKVEGATLAAKGEERSVRGRAIVVHSKADIGEIQQPSGGSGKPIACAVIE